MVRTKYRMLFFTRLMVMVPRVLLHNQPKIRHNLRIKVNSNRKEKPSPTLVKLHSQQQLVGQQNLLKEMSSEQFCSPSTLEQQILKLEKLILVFLLTETTLHSMHSSNRLKMLRELFSSTLQILQKQYSILSKYMMVLVQLHYLVHIRNSSLLQHMLVLVDLQNMELQSRNKYLVMSAKVPSIHLLELPKVSRENLLQERSFTPRLVLQQPESRATLSMRAGTFLPTGAATETRYVPLYPASGTITISGELTHPEIQYIPAVTTGGLSTVSGGFCNSCERYCTICIWSFLWYWIWRRSIRKKYLCRYRKYEYYRRRFNYKRSIQNSTDIYHHRLIILNKSEENSAFESDNAMTKQVQQDEVRTRNILHLLVLLANQRSIQLM